MSPIRRLWNAFRRARLDDDLQQEIETHLALIEERERAQGSDTTQARQRARAAFGSPLGYRERALDAVVATWIENVMQGCEVALRRLVQTPGVHARRRRDARARDRRQRRRSSPSSSASS